jgi:hypothetical protein
VRRFSARATAVLAAVPVMLAVAGCESKDPAARFKNAVENAGYTVETVSPRPTVGFTTDVTVAGCLVQIDSTDDKGKAMNVPAEGSFNFSVSLIRARPDVLDWTALKPEHISGRSVTALRERELVAALKADKKRFPCAK